VVGSGILYFLLSSRALHGFRVVAILMFLEYGSANAVSIRCLEISSLTVSGYDFWL